MIDPCVEYKALIQNYLNDEFSSLDFQKLYIEKFKNEERLLDECLFLILDEFFGDVDTYTEDEGLLVGNSDFYLNQDMFREKAKSVLNRLFC
ncbi:colicin immunity domain-containing protein [Pseudomonas marginalis]|uniref:colicin immunity domain-containing protein n=1 Tax=Pseudomonas marginalis TaxID=298 RepID=UPI002A36D2DE|nr:colicin immunity domain-containing protein [Pseudomonas marginalis]WPN23924.1 colicin immunity domain-containing protein [Pseudomonas marginalis]